MTETANTKMQEQAEPMTPEGAEAESSGDGKSGYSRSTIAFPYGSLRDAEQIAQELGTRWPGYAEPEQLAGGMGTTARSGTFRQKTATARTFGIITISRKRIALTGLGKRLADPQKRDTARVEAFLHVPLFKALYESHKDGVLPSEAALEKEIVSLGVSPKQPGKARQSFQRSAELAGFFKHGRDRLILPAEGMKSGGEQERPKRENGAGVAGSLPPELQSLMLRLLEDGESWTPDDIQEFLSGARQLHQVLTRTS